MFTYILILLGCILVSNIISRFLPHLSIPIVQILMGAILVMLDPHFNIEMESHTFLLMFIAPLLFYDGKHVDKKSLWAEKKNILLMALVLVVATVLVVGILINKLIPSIPLAAAFALAAALSPTDYVAVSALSQKISIPNKVTHIIEGEGLMNDASGLVSFKFAIAAVLTNQFSVFDATLSFLIVSIGGVICGFILQNLLILFDEWISNLGMDDLTVKVLLQILTPFLIYIISEEVFHVSGVMAVVTSGMVYSLSKEYLKEKDAKVKEVEENTWSVLVYVLNGLVFIIVGLQLPSIINSAFNESTIDIVRAIRDVLIISFVLLFLRFIWVLFMYKSGNKKEKSTNKIDVYDALLTSLSGVRGAVTLATILSIPLILDNGDAFPQRNLILFLAVGVILVTLCIATFILPLLAKKDEEEELKHTNQLNKAQVLIWNKTIDYLEKLESENIYKDAVVGGYKQKINQLEVYNLEYKIWERNTKEERRLLSICLEKEIEHTNKLLQDNKVSEECAYMYETILKEKMKLISLKKSFIIAFKRTKIFFNMFKSRKIDPDKSQKRFEKIKEIHQLSNENANYIIDLIKKNKLTDNEKVSKMMINYYEQLKVRTKINLTRGNKEEKQKFEIKSLQVERNIIQNLFEQGKISWNVASELRKNLNYVESDMLR